MNCYFAWFAIARARSLRLSLFGTPLDLLLARFISSRAIFLGPLAGRGVKRFDCSCRGIVRGNFFGGVGERGSRGLVAMSLRPSARVEVRKKGYKLAVDADEARRKREEGMVEIRKSKREDSLLKKRREGMQQQQFSAPVQTAALEKKVRGMWVCVLGLGIT